MSIETLSYINTELSKVINYQFMEYSGTIKYPYFVGEYIETPIDYESGYQESSFILNGFTRGKYLDLEKCKTKIEQLFNDKTTILKNNTGVVVSYQNSLVVPTGDTELKRIQINLIVKEWKVNLNG